MVMPIYWGSWWLPESGGVFNWLDVNAALMRVVTGRYMDGLNQSSRMVLNPERTQVSK